MSVPTVQECNGPYDDLFVAWPAARRFSRWFVNAAREQYRQADALIAVTPQLAEWLREQTGRNDVDVVPNGANIEVFDPAAPRLPGVPDRYVIFFGALAAWQGVSILLEAVTDSAWPEDLPLVVVGDGAMRPEVERAVAEYPARVLYLGSLPYTQTASAVAGALASLIVKDMPQHAKSGLSPLKLYESLAAGVPVIVSDLPGLSDTVAAAECGVVVPAGDAHAVAQAVAALAEDPVARRAFGDRGRAYVVENASWRARAQSTSGIIERAIRTKADS